MLTFFILIEFFLNLTIHVHYVIIFSTRIDKMKKRFMTILSVFVLLLLASCIPNSIDPIDPDPDPDPDPIVNPYEDLELAIENTNALNSYTLLITFKTEDATFDTIVRMSDSISRIDVLDEITYYEVDGETCYIYERFAGNWSKKSIECSQKGSLELAFLNNFSAAFFDITTVDEKQVYSLKTEHYTSLQLFFNATKIEDFVITYANDYIDTITFVMTRNLIVFNMTFRLANINQTIVSLPTVG